MKIKGIQINGLYGFMNVSLEFTGETTVLYGINGSGKTGILKLLGWFLSGDVDNLFNLEFHSARIVAESGNSHLPLTFKLIRDSDTPIIRVYKNDEELFRLAKQGEVVARSRQMLSLERELGWNGPTIYISTARGRGIDTSDLRILRAIGRGSVDVPPPLERAIEDAVMSFKTAYSAMLGEESALLTALRDAVLEKIAQPFPLHVEPETEMIRRLGNVVSHFTDFFEASLTPLFEIDEEGLREKLISDLPTIKLGAFATVLQLERLEEIVSAGVKGLDRVRQPIRHYLDVINQFYAATGKQCVVDDRTNSLSFQGQGNRPLEPASLSSGEKELLFMLTIAAFGLEGRAKPGLLIVDEPELSLHVKWQETLLPSLRMLNPEMQIIAATHSPEIAASARPHLVAVDGGQSN